MNIRYILGMKSNVVGALSMVALTTIALTPNRSFAQDNYPSRVITVVASVGAGSAGDSVARIVSEHMSQTLGQRVVVENVPATSGVLAAQRLASAAPDGYTLLAGGDVLINTIPFMFKNARYDPRSDFEPITQLMHSEWGLVAHPKLGVKTFNEFVELAKQKPGGIEYASGGVGSSQHIAMARFEAMSGLKLTQVPYKTATAALNDVVGGFVPVMFSGLSPAMPFVNDGRLVLLANANETRSPQAPNVATIGEAGVKGYFHSSYLFLAAPRGTHPAIIDKLYVAAALALKDPIISAKLTSVGSIPWGSAPAVFKAKIAKEYQDGQKLIESLGISASPQ